MRFEGQSFVGQTLELDGRHYLRCTIRDCILLYRGTTDILLEQCALQDNEFRYMDAAARTIQALQGIALAGPSGLDHVLKLVVTGVRVDWARLVQLADESASPENADALTGQ
jgi:hypothetical protein